MEKMPLSAEELANVSEKYREISQNEALDYANEQVADMAHIEKNFAKQIESGDNVLAKEELERWEDDFSDDWSRMQAKLREVDATSRDEAEIVRPLMTNRELDTTVEAYTGHYYQERSRALREAIEERGREEDLETVRTLFMRAAEHIEYKYMNADDINAMGYTEYDMKRTAAHNRLIRQLNDLNDLAREYGTRPFTPRNFWTSEGRQESPAVKDRMVHDRHLVEAYIDKAFRRQVDKAEKERELRAKYGRF